MVPTRSLVSVAALALLGCSSRPPPAPLPPPHAMPPGPSQVSLAAARVIHPPWTAPEPTPLPRRLRGLNAVILQPVLASANDPVRACYTALLSYNPRAAGGMRVLMRVSPEGNVSDVEFVGAPDPALALLQPCVRNAVLSRRFPASRSAALVSFPFVFRNRAAAGAEAPAPPTATPRPGEVAVENPTVIEAMPWQPTLTPNAVPANEQTRDLAQLAIPDVTTMVGTCYAAALVMEPTLTGDFTLNLGLEPSGTVNRVDVSEQGAMSPLVRDCVVALGRSLRFHPARIPANLAIPVTLAHAHETPPATPPSAPPAAAPTPAPAPPSGFGAPPAGAAPAPAPGPAPSSGFGSPPGATPTPPPPAP